MEYLSNAVVMKDSIIAEEKCNSTSQAKLNGCQYIVFGPKAIIRGHCEECLLGKK